MWRRVAPSSNKPPTDRSSVHPIRTPKDVFDRRAVEKGQVVFYDVAYVEVQPIVKGHSVAVKLKDFGVYYRQDNIDSLTNYSASALKYKMIFNVKIIYTNKCTNRFH
jgi:hypothetical protein